MSISNWLADPPVFWSAVAAIVMLSGVAGSLTSWGISTWTRRRNRPEPEWYVSLRRVPELRDVGNRSDERLMLRGDLHQVGDTSAFSVRIATAYGTLIIDEQFVQDGETYFLPVAEAGGRYPFSLNVAVQDWEAAELRLEWTVAPVRLNKRQASSISVSRLPQMVTSLTDFEIQKKNEADFERHIRKLGRT